MERGSASRNEDENYALALALAAGVLSESDVAIEQRGDAIDLSAVVVDFEALFENYVRNSLTLAVTSGRITLRIEDGNTTGKKPLFDSSPKPTAEPDVVITDDHARPLLLVEVKYKSFPDRSDINQVIAYGASYRLSDVVLVHQADDSAHAGLRMHGQIGNLRIWRYGFPLDQIDLEAEEQRFAKAVLGLISVREQVDRGNVVRMGPMRR
jgi:5-methylcytosine-specific restriction enzyme subunit McrC